MANSKKGDPEVEAQWRDFCEQQRRLIETLTASIQVYAEALEKTELKDEDEAGSAEG